MCRKAVFFYSVVFFYMNYFFSFSRKEGMALNLYANDASYFVQYILSVLNKNIGYNIGQIPSLHLPAHMFYLTNYSADSRNLLKYTPRIFG